MHPKFCFMINMAEHERLWEQVYRILRERIESGTYPVNSAIPSISLLEQEFPVSRVTIRHALTRLAEEGFTRAISGKGRYVRPEENWNPAPESASQ